MMRGAPLALVPFLLAGAWRREGHVPQAGDRRPPARTLTMDEANERERPLRQQVAALEARLRESEEKIDAYRVKLARLLNDNREGRLLLELECSRKHAARLEADFAVLEEAWVTLVAAHRRSD